MLSPRVVLTFSNKFHLCLRQMKWCRFYSCYVYHMNKFNSVQRKSLLCSNHVIECSPRSVYRINDKQINGTTVRQSSTLSPPEYEVICNETLESLTDYFDVLIEENVHLTNADVTYGDGVLTVNFGSPHGTYVINRQTPNKQIWLSSPTSGPKRYDFDATNNAWIYKHDGKSLHDLLQEEISGIVKSEMDFHSNCSHSGRK